MQRGPLKRLREDRKAKAVALLKKLPMVTPTALGIAAVQGERRARWITLKAKRETAAGPQRDATASSAITECRHGLLPVRIVSCYWRSSARPRSLTGMTRLDPEVKDLFLLFERTNPSPLPFGATQRARQRSPKIVRRGTLAAGK